MLNIFILSSDHNHFTDILLFTCYIISFFCRNVKSVFTSGWGCWCACQPREWTHCCLSWGFAFFVTFNFDSLLFFSFCSLFKLPFQAFTESVDSTYGCLLAGGRVVVATANWWELFLFCFYKIDKKSCSGHETQVVDAKQLLFSPMFALPSCFK